MLWMLGVAAMLLAETDRRSALAPVPLERLTVTEGRIRRSADRLVVDEPKVRAVVKGSAAREAELQFWYLGPTGRISPLSSGERRQQIGLKLRAQSACNVLYVMWRIAPEPGLVVSLKRNPGLDEYRDCGAAGYRTIRPKYSAALGPPAPGRHVLRAQLQGRSLKVFVQDALVWEGDAGTEALELDGPVGLRADNSRFEFVLLTPEGT